MISSRIITRLFHLQSNCYAAEKSLLASLRKKTGYTFTNCKKALELHNNDIGKAENWLKEQAQQFGWSKATKLEGRQTTQGLIAVAVQHNNAALVEVNCETDFVARNQEFQKVAEEAAASCLVWTSNEIKVQSPVNKIGLDAKQLKGLLARDGKSLADHIALMIGTVGENASLKRALCIKADQGIFVSAYAHPSNTQSNNVLLGRVGGVVAFKQLEQKDDLNIEEIGKSLCQHIVGMNPKKIGNEDDKPAANKDDEICLIHQEFLLNDQITVKEYLEENQIQVIDYVRFECGENLDSILVDEPLETLETCQ